MKTWSIEFESQLLASKSFIKDVTVGRKQLTSASFEKTATGLGLTKVWKEYPEALISAHEIKFIS